MSERPAVYRCHNVLHVRWSRPDMLDGEPPKYEVAAVDGGKRDGESRTRRAGRWMAQVLPFRLIDED